MTTGKLKAMMEAQKKAKMDQRLYLKPMSSTSKVVYVPPVKSVIITKTTQEDSAAAKTRSV